MKLSMNWLKDFVNIDVSKEELADRITFTGIEVEEATKLVEATNLVIGYVKERVKHPNADTLNVCTVDVGSEELQIVCGAPNVDKGQKVIVAMVGAILPGDFKIKKSKIRDVESFGMICSLSELGIDNKFISESELDGIHVMSEDAPVGENPLSYLMYDDEVLELDVLADRPDALSMYGLAHEVAAIYDLDVKIPTSEVKQSTENITEYLNVEVQTDDNPTYYARLIKNIKVGESPQFIKSRLVACGIRPINNVVDITNYVLLEFGQPLHAFDYDKLGSKIIVRNALKDEKIVTLDNIERSLEENDIVITDGEKPVALGGVMGGANTEVDDNTTSIVLEAALFNAKCIRSTSKRLGLRSDSSTRFEKGIDYNRIEESLNRAVYLLSEYANGEVIGDIVGVNNFQAEEGEINLSCDKVRRLLGVEISDDEIQEMLRRFKFEYKYNNGDLVVKTTSKRRDVRIAEDVIEEIGRLYGYDKIEGTTPNLELKSGGYSQSYKLNKDIRKVLTSLGLYETITYSLTKENNLPMFTADEITPIKLMRPMSEDKSTLRYSLIPSLLEVAEYNMARSINDIKIFEIGSSYKQVDDEYVETTMLSSLFTGTFTETRWQGISKQVDFYVVKGVVETLFDYLGLNGRYTISTCDDAPKEYHPTRVAKIVLQNKTIGYIGQIHPNIASKEVYAFELSVEKLLASKVRLIKFKDVPKHPSMVRDLAIVAKKEIVVSDIISVIKRSGGKLLTDVNVFDVYEGDKLEAGEKSIAFKLTYQDPKNTLTDDVVKSSIDKILIDLEKKLKIKIRS